MDVCVRQCQSLSLPLTTWWKVCLCLRCDEAFAAAAWSSAPVPRTATLCARAHGRARASQRRRPRARSASPAVPHPSAPAEKAANSGLPLQWGIHTLPSRIPGCQGTEGSIRSSERQRKWRPALLLRCCFALGCCCCAPATLRAARETRTSGPTHRFRGPPTPPNSWWISLKYIKRCLSASVQAEGCCRSVGNASSLVRAAIHFTAGVWH